MNRAKLYAQVAVNLPIDGLFTYRLPPDMDAAIGHAVLVPFGQRRVSGVIVALSDTTDVKRVKAVSRLLDPEPVADSTQLRFLSWAADYYLAGPGEMVATALPARYRAKTRRVWTITDAGVEAVANVPDPLRAPAPLPDTAPSPAQNPLPDAQIAVLRELLLRPRLTRAGLARRLKAEHPPETIEKALGSLHRASLVTWEDRETRASAATIQTVRLTAAPEALVAIGGARMRGVLARLSQAGGQLDLRELVALEGEGARSALTRLSRKGLIERGAREDRDAVAWPVLEESPRPLPVPNAHQAAAIQTITQDAPKTWLLHGVTGSGKTEVYLQAASRVLAQGRQVLVLVPEIALTPLLTGRFRARFGDRIAVLHSGLSPAERLREWRRIRAGDAGVAVGARSALFAPFSDLGLVVVDEEHEDSYKQDDGVRYHARDLAVLRGRMARCPVVLGSATPSLESWQNAQDGRYGRLLLPTRATARSVPRIELVDMRGLPPQEPFAPQVLAAIQEALDQGGQAIILYNRRGYAPVVECPDCGAHFDCPSCGTGLVLHRERRRMVCHYCGFWREHTRTCAHCGGTLAVLGHGTERIEEALAQRFPDVGILRMDADTTSGRHAHHRLLESFRKGEARLLVGTQLVAKGHDFPDVHVAAVIGVDHVLMLPDFRSAERTHALVTQLAGRAGRGEVAGRVLVQTRHTDHFVFRLLARDEEDMSLDDFYIEEARIRRVLGQPPFVRLVNIVIQSTQRDHAHAHASELAIALRQAAAPLGRAVDVLGPVAAPFSRLVGRWRFQVLLRGRDVPRFRSWLAQVRPTLRAAPRRGVRVTVDVDPRNLM